MQTEPRSELKRALLVRADAVATALGAEVMCSSAAAAQPLRTSLLADPAHQGHYAHHLVQLVFSTKQKKSDSPY